MGNDHSCDIHASHPNREARDACIQKRKSAGEIEELKEKHQFYTCQYDHYHKTLESKKLCEEKERRNGRVLKTRAYTCGLGHIHSSLDEYNACHDLQRSHKHELERVRSAIRYTCNFGHSHSSFEEVCACHDYKLKEKSLNMMKKSSKTGNREGMAEMGIPENKCLALKYKPAVIKDIDSTSASDSDSDSD